MRIGTIATSTALSLGLVIASATGAHAAGYYNGYTTVAATPDTQGTSISQGFVASGNQLYSVKVNGTDTRAVIYRTHRTSGATTVLKNLTQGANWNSWLGHANDMTLATIDNKPYLFVVTMKGGAAQVVKLLVTDTGYRLAGKFKVSYLGKEVTPSGISLVSVSSTKITFLFKGGRGTKAQANLQVGAVALRANSGTIGLGAPAKLQVSGARVNNAVVSDIATYSDQGFHYDAAKKVLYYPLTKGNRSVVLVYKGVPASPTGTYSPSTAPSFRVTSSDFSRLFEIESVSVSGGKLYFNTNRVKSSGANNHDGVHVFNGYTTG